MKTRLRPADPQAELPPPVERRSEETCASSIRAESPVENESRPQPVTTPPAASHRPSGRYVVAGILLVVVTLASYSLWNTFFRYSAHGFVTGRVVQVAAPWDAGIEMLLVRPGQSVRQGDVLAIVSDPELEATIGRLGDDLRFAQAELAAEAAKLSVQASREEDAAQEAIAELHRLQGDLTMERSRLDELESQIHRREESSDVIVFSPEELDSLRFEAQGLRSKAKHLEQAIVALESRVDSTTGSHEVSRLNPRLAKMENCQNEIHRLREKQRRGTLRAPVDGKVISIAGNVGEFTEPEAPLFELLQDRSTELVVYVEQGHVADFEVGREVRVLVGPSNEPLVCQVARVGDRYGKPDELLPGTHRPSEQLLPIHLKPPADVVLESTLRLGGAVRLPSNWRVAERG